MNFFNVAPERVEALRRAMKPDALWDVLIDFVDTIETVEELDALAPVILQAEYGPYFVQGYREDLARWPAPKLPEGFAERCPLLAKRLDTPCKVRILLRGADFRRVPPLLMGEVLEDIIRRHEVDGEQCVRYSPYRGDQRCDALRIVYHTQPQARTLTRLALPGKTCAGVYMSGSKDELFVDWRSKEAIEAEYRSLRP